ncbi:hypothetical protein C8R44DRAFT_852497 [Mycena epipterygia]|nr:hypothetical protein C8R44DRAFT_852497 [Mycena epipterygia]
MWSWHIKEQWYTWVLEGCTKLDVQYVLYAGDPATEWEFSSSILVGSMTFSLFNRLHGKAVRNAMPGCLGNISTDLLSSTAYDGLTGHTGIYYYQNQILGIIEQVLREKWDGFLPNYHFGRSSDLFSLIPRQPLLKMLVDALVFHYSSERRLWVALKFRNPCFNVSTDGYPRIGGFGHNLFMVPPLIKTGSTCTIGCLAKFWLSHHDLSTN